MPARKTTTTATYPIGGKDGSVTPLPEGLYLEFKSGGTGHRVPMVPSVDVQRHSTPGHWGFGGDAKVDGRTVISAGRMTGAAAYYEAPGADTVAALPDEAVLRLVTADGKQQIVKGERSERSVTVQSIGSVDCPVFTFKAGPLGSADGCLRVQLSPGRKSRSPFAPRFRISVVRENRNSTVRVVQPAGVGSVTLDW